MDDPEWAALTKAERQKCEAIVARIHRGMGHCNNRALASALSQRKAHRLLIHAAKHHHCEACEMAKRMQLRPISSGVVNEPGAVVGTDNFYWMHPTGKRAARCQIFVDDGSGVTTVRVHAANAGDSNVGQCRWR